MVFGGTTTIPETVRLAFFFFQNVINHLKHKVCDLIAGSIKKSLLDSAVEPQNDPSIE